MPSSGSAGLDSLSPAWNPSSATPLPTSGSSSSAWDPLFTPLFPASSSSTAQPPPAPVHPLLIPELSGIKLKVLLSGKPAIAQSVDGTLFQVHNKRMLSLDISKVQPKHPDALRDNGLCVVLSGDDCGKFVRRLHFRKVDGKSFVKAAVVTRKGAKEANEIVSPLQIVCCPPEVLCMCDETKEERKSTDTVLENLRVVAKAQGST